MNESKALQDKALRDAIAKKQSSDTQEEEIINLYGNNANNTEVNSTTQ